MIPKSSLLLDPKEQLWLTTYDAVLYLGGWRSWSTRGFCGSGSGSIPLAHFRDDYLDGPAVAIWPSGQPQYKLAWGIVAGSASLASILFMTVVNVPERVKSLGKFHSEFLRLRLSVEAFSQDVDSMDLREAQIRFRALREEGHKLIGQRSSRFRLTAWKEGADTG